VRSNQAWIVNDIARRRGAEASAGRLRHNLPNNRRSSVDCWRQIVGARVSSFFSESDGSPTKRMQA